MEKLNFATILRFAWRDSRRQRARLLLFVSSIIIGIAALVAINSFSDNLQKDINSQARELLGADLAIDGLNPPPPSVMQLMDSIGGTRSRIVSFLSMAYFPQKEGTRPVQVKAQQGVYPFYGTLKTEPANAANLFQEEKKALIDNVLQMQFDLHVGDSVKIGEVTYAIAGTVLSAPGRLGLQSAVAPSVYLPLSAVDSANLLVRGSRVQYQYFFKLDPKKDYDGLTQKIKPALTEAKFSVENIGDRKRSTGNSFNQMADFLNLVGFIALLLGCIGVASAVSIYVKDKLPTVAILRTLGASGRQAFLIYLSQIAVMGFGGAMLGSALGTLIQKFLPIILKDFLPIDDISTDPSVSAILQGVFTGFGVSVLFALLPLLTIRRTSPLRTLSSGFEEAESGRDPVRWLVYALISVFVFGFTYWQTQSVRSSTIFILGIGVALGLLALIAKGLMWILRRRILRGLSFAVRQSVANLYRPQNQTMTLMVSIGLGTLLISTLFLIQQLLIKQISFAGSGNQPNMILFDIQPQQRDSVAQLVELAKMPVIQKVPIVTIRLEELNGLSRAQFLKDSTNPIPKFIYEREWRVTYRDTLISSEKMQEGSLPPSGRLPDGTVGITVSNTIIKDMHAKVGDKATFNVQGALINTTITGIREVDFNRVQTNFLILFPSGILEQAPQFNVVVTRVESDAQSAKFQQLMVKNFPNVSIVELTQILKTVDDVLSKISFAIRFMALFSILTGLMVLISSVYLSKYQRVRESVLLRTIGASRSTILTINSLEYLWLGTLATLSGVGMSLLAGYGLAKFVFKVPFNIDWLTLLATPLSITALIVFIGLLSTRKVVSESPLEVLRAEI
ncbi:MAG: ABC transporter permease [Saprospiraceae bacterium]|nr:ABC transporter permease [Saprospiraceae bacterium]